jgi:hypothetical protein
MPLMTPVDAFSVNPADKVPELTLHDFVPVPPVAARVAL